MHVMPMQVSELSPCAYESATGVPPPRSPSGMPPFAGKLNSMNAQRRLQLGPRSNRRSRKGKLKQASTTSAVKSQDPKAVGAEVMGDAEVMLPDAETVRVVQA